MTRYDEHPFPGLPSISELTDESNACRHGSLPFDGDVACSCWNLSWKPKRHGTYGRPKPTYSRHVKRRAVQLYQDGMSTRQVARRFGASQRTVLGWVRTAGVEVRGRGRPWPSRRAA